ncbi:zinc ABC transporter substrate-binding protein [Psychrobacillus sp. INOP01]|uniref:metal ABC transporter solute-binding protein, Zn/Mn family n=1 Tax=Psychrobacillus sp. INOP01 TaxID=2829187 RepID=UPI001BA5BDB7|nr:zinc ABC transporter substrate-binding protein [Psychrobacillus sp. INOP01]QUG42462.1 zinc ABC transporter substrate-binding protein [Psychrobacillus sp. INOP01]
MKRIIIGSVLFLLLFLAACGNSEEKVENEKQQVQVYTTVYPLQYFAERIGGESVDVSSIYPAGANEHTFEPTQKDMMSLADADLFFYIGLGLEGFVENAKKTLAEEHVKMVATVDAVSEEQLEESVHVHEEATTEESHDHDHEEASTEESHDHEHEVESAEGHDSHEGHDHGDIDPHIWMSPKISQSLALSIKDSLVEISPEQQETFEKNYEELVNELQTLDADFEEMAQSAKNKTFFVSHAAFGYIANTYDLEQLAVAGLNSQDEPSQKELTKLIDLAEEKNISYILFEQNVSSKLTEVIQREIGADSLVLHNLGVLSKEDIENKETYFTLMNKNLEILRTVLN